MLKLYHNPGYEGRSPYWWTQRTPRGFCFEIREQLDGKFAVIVVDECIFAIAETFSEAEMRLRDAERIYG